MPEKDVFLTEEGLKRLEDELDELKSVRRKEVAEKIKQALSFGDISENSEYDQAKNEQAQLEERIAKLETMLRNARIIDEDDITTDVVGIGSSFLMQQELHTSFLADGGSIRNLGIIFGALAATLFASQFKIKKIKTLRQVVAAILGGLLMGYGARLANGCNIGALFTAIASFSLSGWVFGAFLLVGAFIGSKLLAKYFM